MTQQPMHRVIKADTSLQNKIGMVSVNQAALERAEALIENIDIDFAPMAAEYLEDLAHAISQCRSGAYPSKTQARAAVTTPVMQLKANASTFGYPLIGEMADVMLQLMEGISELDNDVITLLDAHHKTLNLIISKEMKGDGGAPGKVLKQELQNACNRYLRRAG